MTLGADFLSAAGTGQIQSTNHSNMYDPVLGLAAGPILSPG